SDGTVGPATRRRGSRRQTPRSSGKRSGRGGTLPRWALLYRTERSWEPCRTLCRSPGDAVAPSTLTDEEACHADLGFPVARARGGAGYRRLRLGLQLSHAGEELQRGDHRRRAQGRHGRRPAEGPERRHDRGGQGALEGGRGLACRGQAWGVRGPGEGREVAGRTGEVTTDRSITSGRSRRRPRFSPGAVRAQGSAGRGRRLAGV